LRKPAWNQSRRANVSEALSVNILRICSIIRYSQDLLVFDNTLLQLCENDTETCGEGNC
jgi:hypothetical protein